MNRDNRDISILRKIVKYCDRIESAKSRFGDSMEALKSDEDYRDVAAMNILQIGELTAHLSEEFQAGHKEIPWRRIKNMRNIAAHEYDKFDHEYLWGTMSEDIPALRDYCEEIVRKHQVMEQGQQQSHDMKMY